MLSIKNLLNNQKTFVERANLGKKKTESLRIDLDKINRFCKDNLNSQTPPGLAIFSCGKEKFWEVFELPSPPRNRILIDQDPYVRPLSAILNEHHRICVLVFDTREAKWFDLLMGDFSLLDQMESDVPSKVREGGWEGYESKRIERHIATHLHDYFKEIAKKTFTLFKANQFEWLFLGCNDEHGQEFEPLLHPLELNVHNGIQVGGCQVMEYHDVIHPVQKLRPKTCLQGLHHALLHLLPLVCP